MSLRPPRRPPFNLWPLLLAACSVERAPRWHGVAVTGGPPFITRLTASPRGILAWDRAGHAFCVSVDLQSTSLARCPFGDAVADRALQLVPPWFAVSHGERLWRWDHERGWVPLGRLSGARSIAGGDRWLCAADQEHRARCWVSCPGDDLAHVLTGPATHELPGAVTSLSSPIGMPGTLCALDADGRLSCADVGGETAPACGIGRPRRVGDFTHVVDFAGGPDVGCAALRDGRMTCWGAPALCPDAPAGAPPCEGVGGACAAAPCDVTGVRGARQVVVARDTACALLADRSVVCWGQGDLGLRADVHCPPRSSAPNLVAGLSDVDQLVAWRAQTFCARTTGGRLRCWGNPDADDHLRPFTPERQGRTRVRGLTGAVALASGDAHTCAVGGDGRVFCWGRNALGELGDGTTQTTGEPARVALGEGAAGVVANGLHTCAWSRTGRMWCWGPLRHRRAVGPTALSAGRASPPEEVQRFAGRTFATMFVARDGEAHHLDLDGAGRAWYWLERARGLGATTPAPLPALDHARAVFVGWRDLVAIDAGGAVRHFALPARDDEERPTAAPPPRDLPGPYRAMRCEDFRCCFEASGGEVHCRPLHEAPALQANASREEEALRAALRGDPSRRSHAPSSLCPLHGREIPPLPSSFHCEIAEGGAVDCEGDNADGQLGSGEVFGTQRVR